MRTVVLRRGGMSRLSRRCRRCAPPRRSLIDALEPVYIAETEAEREAVFSFRYSVYGAELGRKLGNADHGRKRVHDEEDDKPYTTLLYTDDGAGQLTGTTRIRRWEPGQVPAKDWEAFSMERFEGLRDMPTAEVGRLMIEPGHRGQLGLVSMSCAVYQLCAGELAADAAFINCAAGLVRHYRLLGFRTYAGKTGADSRRHRGAAGADPGDRAYLEQAGAFVAPFATSSRPRKRAPVDVERWSRAARRRLGAGQVRSAAVWERVDRLAAGGERPSVDARVAQRGHCPQAQRQGLPDRAPGGPAADREGALPAGDLRHSRRGVRGA